MQWIEACKNGDINAVHATLNTQFVSDTFVNLGAIEAILNDQYDVLNFLIACRKSSLVVYDILLAAVVKANTPSYTLIIDTYEINWLQIICDAIRKNHYTLMYVCMMRDGDDDLVGYTLVAAMSFKNAGAIDYLFNKPNLIRRMASEVSMMGHLNAVQLVMSRDATLAKTMLYAACTAGQVNIVLYLLQTGQITRIQLNTGARRAALLGHVDILDILFTHGAKNYNKIMLMVCAMGSINLVRYMITKGCTIDYGAAVMMAFRFQQKDTLDMLLALAPVEVDWNEIWRYEKI